jgi:hypothetical protein
MKSNPAGKNKKPAIVVKDLQSKKNPKGGGRVRAPAFTYSYSGPAVGNAGADGPK